MPSEVLLSYIFRDKSSSILRRRFPDGGAILGGANSTKQACSKEHTYYKYKNVDYLPFERCFNVPVNKSIKCDSFSLLPREEPNSKA